jgi:hypothetical protein
VYSDGRNLPELATPFVTRFETAEQKAIEEWEQKIAQTPIDDAAWEEELERRRDIETRGL